MVEVRRFTTDIRPGYVLSHILKADEEYIASGRWKCPDSPTGAHFSREVSREGRYGLFLCIHCMRVVKLPIDISIARDWV